MSAIGYETRDGKENSRVDYSTEDELSKPAQLAQGASRCSASGRTSSAAATVTPHSNVRE